MINTKEEDKGMKNLKSNKWLILLVVGILLSAFAVGCGNESTEPNQPEDPGEEQTVTINDVADKYFAQMPEHIYKINDEDLKERIEANDDSMLIISIRSPEDYAKGHIKGAVNIPFKQVHEYLDKLPADKELIVYCYSGQTAGQTVAILNMYGYNARSLNLGFNKGWVGKYNYPVDTTPNELPADVTPAQTDPAIAKILKDYFANMPDHNRIIACEDAQAMIDKGEDIQIISIRSSEDYAKGHIKGAINIPFKEVNNHFNEIANDKPVFVYCYSGQTAGQTVAVLNTLGIDARSIKSGFNLGWEPAGLPIEQ